jgi:hypothetical protein
MPYSISQSGSGYKVTTPNHPQGFSKKPQTKKQASIQKWIIEQRTGETDSGAKIGIKRQHKSK